MSNLQDMNEKQMIQAVQNLVPNANFNGPVISNALTFHFSENTVGENNIPVPSRGSIAEGFREIIAGVDSPDKEVHVNIEGVPYKVFTFNPSTLTWGCVPIH